MTAREWFEDLEEKANAATPGPWVCKEGEGFDEDDVCITAEEREGMIDIAKIERGSPNAGMDEPFQSEQTANAAYIVAACNAVPRLVEMVRAMSSVMAGIPDIELTPDEILWDFFKDTDGVIDTVK